MGVALFPTASYSNRAFVPWPNPKLGSSVPCNRLLSYRRNSLSLLSISNSTAPCLAAKSQPPPDSDPHPVSASLSKLQDRVQIFFAVLFWMSLFFWACAWDDKNRPNKGTKFRR